MHFSSLSKYRLVLGLGLGMVLGALVTSAALYDKTGRRAFQKIQELAGLRENTASRFSYGYTESSHASWTSVRSPTQPQWNVRPGFDVELVAEGLDYPVNLAFVADPGSEPDSPVFYVNELHGTVKYLGRDGNVYTYATGLINFQPIDDAKSDETGLSGLTLIPGTEDLLVTGAFKDESSGLLQNRILRLISAPGGRRARRAEVVRILDEFTSPSNQIQQARFGPDGKLYVSVGDAENHLLSLDLDRFGGKVLRMELDGSACVDNPYYDEYAPDSPRSYVYASGVRNIFDMDFDAQGRLFAVDNGKNIDRFLEVIAGGRYGWNGVPESIRVNALYTWGPIDNTAPVGLEILQRGTLGEGTAGHGYVAYYGPAAATGPNAGKAVVELAMDPASGMLTRAPELLIQYAGEHRATVLGLAEGPDGLYFTDFFGETTGINDAQGRIYKIIPSEETLGLPRVEDEQLASLPPEQRGHVFFHQHCTPCHTVDGVGGREGPELTHVLRNLRRRLDSVAYEATLDQLLASEASFLVEQRPRLEQVRNVRGDERVRIWLVHHLEEPRFDHLHAKMPSFALALPAPQRDDIIAYLMTRR